MNRSLVGFRLAVSFCVVIGMGLASYFFVTRDIRETVQRTARAEAAITAAVSSAQDAAVAAHDTAAYTVSYVLNGQQPDLENKWEANEAAIQALSDVRTALARMPAGWGPLARQSLLVTQKAAMDQECSVCNPLEDAAIRLAQQDHSAAARHLLETRYVAERDRLVLDIADLVQALGQAREQTEASQARLMRRATTAGAAVQDMVLALSLLVGVFITTTTSSAVNKERDALARLLASEETLRGREERFRALAENASDMVAILDAAGHTLYLSPSAAAALGYVSEEYLGRSAFSDVHPDDLERVKSDFEQVLRQPADTSVVEYRLRHADGVWHHLESAFQNLLHLPAVSGVVVNSRDVTERKMAQDLLVHQAFHDALTGLPNRALFLDRLQGGLSRAHRRRERLAVLFIDLDNFKVVNDSLGHEAGDHLLAEVAQRLRSSVREGDTVARLGGDEFTILLEGIAETGGHEAARLAETVAARLLAPLMIAGQEVFVTASVGIAISRDGADPAALLREADVAMYGAKRNGKAGFTRYDVSMDTDTLERLTLEAELRHAISGSELCLHYQPIVELETGRVAEVEALVRWNHPTRGLIPPARFIPIAEETGLILPLGRWVLAEACRQAVMWQRQDQSASPLTLSVNLSARQLQQPDVAAEVARILEEAGLPPECLKLEITESVMMQDAQKTALHLQALRSLGVRLAVDDFGTGYSSMSYLSNFPLDTLKIDRTFISRLDEPEGFAIVQALVSLARSLNLQVTSEGIETEAQSELLRGLCCSHGQGYHFGRPEAEPVLESRPRPRPVLKTATTFPADGRDPLTRAA